MTVTLEAKYMRDEMVVSVSVSVMSYESRCVSLSPWFESVAVETVRR